MTLLVEPYNLANNAATALDTSVEVVSAALRLVYEHHPDQVPDAWEPVQDFLRSMAGLDEAQASGLVGLLQAADDDILAPTNPRVVFGEQALRAYFYQPEAVIVPEAGPDEAAVESAKDEPNDTGAAAGGLVAKDTKWIATGSEIYRVGTDYYLSEGVRVWQVVPGDESEFHDGVTYYDVMGRTVPVEGPAPRPGALSEEEILSGLTVGVQEVAGIDLLSDREIQMIITAVIEETERREYV